MLAPYSDENECRFPINASALSFSPFQPNHHNYTMSGAYMRILPVPFYTPRKPHDLEAALGNITCSLIPVHARLGVAQTMAKLLADEIAKDKKKNNVTLNAQAHKAQRTIHNTKELVRGFMKEIEIGASAIERVSPEGCAMARDRVSTQGKRLAFVVPAYNEAIEFVSTFLREHPEYFDRINTSVRNAHFAGKEYKRQLVPREYTLETVEDKCKQLSAVQFEKQVDNASAALGVLLTIAFCL